MTPRVEKMQCLEESKNTHSNIIVAGLDTEGSWLLCIGKKAKRFNKRHCSILKQDLILPKHNFANFSIFFCVKQL